MKRRLLIPALFICMVVGMSSCVRDYICYCDVKYTGYPGLPDSTHREYEITDKKDQAKSLCEGQSQTYELNGITTEEKCHLY